MAVQQLSEFQSRRASMALLLQPVNDIQSTVTAQTPDMAKLSRTVDMTVFQELLDLDTPSELFSKDVVTEFLLLAPETLQAMDESLHEIDFSGLGTAAQSLRCASMALGLTRIERACERIEAILRLGVDLYYTGIGLGQICDILSFVVKDAHMHFRAARSALSSFYDLPLPIPQDDASDVSDASIEC